MSLSRPGTKARKFQDHVLALIEEHRADGSIPTNVTFLFYEGEQRKFWPKKYKGARTPRQDVSVALMDLRLDGSVDWNEISDETRELSSYLYADTVAEYLIQSVRRARLDVWDGAPPPLILTESRSLKGILDITVAQRYLCSIASTNGQAGGFLHTDVIPLLQRDPERPVAYLGDLDLQGGQIESNSRRVIEAAVGQELDWERIALTEEQVDEYDLRRLTIMKTDNRFRPARQHPAIETETLGQRLLQDLLRERLDGLLPEPLEDVLVRQDEEKAQAVKRLKRWK